MRPAPTRRRCPRSPGGSGYPLARTSSGISETSRASRQKGGGPVAPRPSARKTDYEYKPDTTTSPPLLTVTSMLPHGVAPELHDVGAEFR